MEISEKQCTNCKEIKQYAFFSKHFKAKDGLQAHCKQCVAERAARNRVGRPCITCGSPKEVGVPKGAKLCMTCAQTCYSCQERPRKHQHRMCTACIAKADKARNANPERKFMERITRVASKYKVTRAVAAVLSVMKTCSACGKDCSKPGQMHVDHCHSTGRVRGVLCFNCNAALGHVGDSIKRLNMLVDYINASKEEAANGVTDLQKARHYIDLLIEMESDNPGAPHE